MNGCDYDQIDVKNAYNSGYWIGAISGAIGMFALCLLLGVFLTS